MKQNLKILIVINPLLNSFENDLKQLKKYNPDIYKTTGKNDKNKIKKILNKKKYNTLIVIGGDGTINPILSLIINTKINLAIIPRGSTNGIFHELKMVEKPLSKMKIKKIDIIQIGKNYSAHLAGFGLNAQIIKQSRAKNLKGLIKYIVSFFQSINKIKNYEFKVNEKIIKTKLLVIANGQSYGKSATINPRGKIDDGQFEVCTLTEQKPYTKVKIINKNNAPFHIDGEFIGHPKIVNAKIQKKALQVLI